MASETDTGTGAGGKTDLRVVDGGKPDKIEHRGGDTTGGKLTARQQGFVNSILAGEDQVTAYEQNYTTSGMTRKTMYEAASRLFANSKVSARIKRGQRRIQEAELHSALSLRQHIEKRLFFLSEHADTDANRLKALDLLGRTEKVGMYVERTADVTENLTEEQVLEQLESQLRIAFGEIG